MLHNRQTKQKNVQCQKLQKNNHRKTKNQLKITSLQPNSNSNIRNSVYIKQR